MVRKIRWICARWEIGLPARHANGCSEVHCKYKRKGKGRRQGQFRKEKKKKQENKYSTGLDLIPGSCPQTRDAIWTAMYLFRDRSHMTSGKRTARHFCNASLLPNNDFGAVTASPLRVVPHRTTPPSTAVPSVLNFVTRCTVRARYLETKTLNETYTGPGFTSLFTPAVQGLSGGR